MVTSRFLSATTLTSLLLLSSTDARAASTKMCEKGLNIFKVTIRAFEGAPCQIGGISYWANKNCKGIEGYEKSSCKANGESILRQKDQKALDYYESIGLGKLDTIQSPADVGKVVETLKANNALSAFESTAWEGIRTHFSSSDSIPRSTSEAGNTPTAPSTPAPQTSLSSDELQKKSCDKMEILFNAGTWEGLSDVAPYRLKKGTDLLQGHAFQIAGRTDDVAVYIPYDTHTLKSKTEVEKFARDYRVILNPDPNSWHKEGSNCYITVKELQPEKPIIKQPEEEACEKLKRLLAEDKVTSEQAYDLTDSGYDLNKTGYVFGLQSRRIGHSSQDTVVVYIPYHTLSSDLKEEDEASGFSLDYKVKVNTDPTTFYKTSYKADTDPTTEVPMCYVTVKELVKKN